MMQTIRSLLKKGNTEMASGRKVVGKTKISITRALAELKNIKSKISSVEQEVTKYAGAIFKDGYTILDGQVSEKEFSTRYEDLSKELKELKDKYRKIKLKLAEANITTKLTINGESLSINEAIILKEQLESEKYFIDNNINVLSELSKKYKSKEDNNTEYLNKLIEKMTGGNRAVKDSDTDSIKKMFDKFNSVKLVTTKTSSELFERRSEIDRIINEINLTLVEVNSSTYIEV